MKEAGQSLLRGGILIIGFIVLVVFLTSLPGGQPTAQQRVAPPAVTQQQPVAPQQVTPSAVRGAQSSAAAAVVSQQASQSFGQRRRRDLPQPAESTAEMERRIRNYLDK